MNVKYGRLLSIVLAIAMLAPAAGCLESVFNRMPIAEFAISGCMESGSPLAFDGTTSIDYDSIDSAHPRGNIAAWEWDFGDGTTGNTSKPTHVYGDTGNYTVKLTVSDNLGKTSTISKNVLISGKMQIKEGDYVEINYIGKYKCNGTIFDTSVYSAALEANKTTGLQMRGNASAYSPLPVVIGDSSATFQNRTYRTVILGLRERLIGMAVGDSKTITIPPEKGYGNWTTNENTTLPRTQTLNLTYNYRNDSDEYRYLEQNNLLVKNKSFLWIPNLDVPINATVTDFTNESVTLKADIENNTQKTGVWGFNHTFIILNSTAFKVLWSADEGTIFRVPPQNMYSNALICRIFGRNETKIKYGVFSISSMQLYQYPAHLIGETLVFEVSVVSIVRK